MADRYLDFFDISDESELDEVQLRIVEIARRDNIKLGAACKKLIADLEARWQEVEPGWKFDPPSLLDWK